MHTIGKVGIPFGETISETKESVSLVAKGWQEKLRYLGPRREINPHPNSGGVGENYERYGSFYESAYAIGLRTINFSGSFCHAESDQEKQKGLKMDGNMFAGLGGCFTFLFVILCVSVPLGVWKLADLGIWFFQHVNIGWN